MWYKSESNTKPVTIDKTSSKKYIYVRKNIEKVEREMEIGIETENEIGENEITPKTVTEISYVYDEMKLPKEVYGIFEDQIMADNRISDVEEVITEIIGGGI